MENEFSLAENIEMPGAEDAIPLVTIMALAHRVMLPSWACNMALALERKAFLEFMIINLVSHNQMECICRRWNFVNNDTSCIAWNVFLVFQ